MELPEPEPVNLRKEDDKENSLIISQDTGKTRLNLKDQFYTQEHIAKECMEHIRKYVPDPKSYYWIEPSAGKGVFLDQLPEDYLHIGIELEPKSNRKDIIQLDFLKFKYNDIRKSHSKILVFGNPPFGRQSSLAKKFIKHSCKFADVIAFILPRSFVKPSMNSSFDLKFHCVYTWHLPENSFRVNDKPYNVPCVFQIWKRETFEREIPKKTEPLKYSYVKHDSPFHIITRRVGVYTGRTFKNEKESTQTFSPQSHYFIQLDDDIVSKVDDIVEKLNLHVFPSNTVGPRSISKNELNIQVNAIITELL